MKAVEQDLRKEMWHLIWDLIFFTASLVMAFLWERKGHSREAFILVAVTYWGMPWSNQRRKRIRTHIDGTLSAEEGDDRG